MSVTPWFHGGKAFALVGRNMALCIMKIKASQQESIHAR